MNVPLNIYLFKNLNIISIDYSFLLSYQIALDDYYHM